MLGERWKKEEGGLNQPTLRLSFHPKFLPAYRTLPTFPRSCRNINFIIIAVLSCCKDRSVISSCFFPSWSRLVSTPSFFLPPPFLYNSDDYPRRLRRPFCSLQQQQQLLEVTRVIVRYNGKENGVCKCKKGGEGKGGRLQVQRGW